MGCDVHPYHEKLNEKGQWEFTGELIKEEEDDYIHWSATSPNGHYDRHYLLFGHLTGGQVRYAADEYGNSLEPLPCNDVPTDMSPEVRKLYEYDGSDGHSHAHRTLAELSKYGMDLMMAGDEDGGGAAMLEFVKTYQDSSIPLENQRIVFWFDN